MPSSATNDPIYLASVFRLEATLFRQSAQILSDSFPTPSNESPASPESVPFYYLVSHAAELLLKAALLKRGLTEEGLKAPNLRHSCAFRRKRSVIPADGDHPFRSMTITESGAWRSRWPEAG